MSVETSTIITLNHYMPRLSDEAGIFYSDTDESITPEITIY